MATTVELPRVLSDLSAGATTVRGVRAEVREDSSHQPALFVVLVLSDPASRLDTWPIDDILELRRKVHTTIAQRLPQLDLPWYLFFEPEHPDLPDDEALVIEEE